MLVQNGNTTESPRLRLKFSQFSKRTEGICVVFILLINHFWCLYNFVHLFGEKFSNLQRIHLKQNENYVRQTFASSVSHQPISRKCKAIAISVLRILFLFLLPKSHTKNFYCCLYRQISFLRREKIWSFKIGQQFFLLLSTKSLQIQQKMDVIFIVIHQNLMSKTKIYCICLLICVWLDFWSLNFH